MFLKTKSLDGLQACESALATSVSHDEYLCRMDLGGSEFEAKCFIVFQVD